MDFPEFFSLTKVNDFIKSSRWRGLAVLSSPVNAAQKLDRVDPATGSLCTDRDVALHVLTKPMVLATAAPLTTTATLVSAKPGVRYYIHSLTGNARLIVTDTTTNTYVTATINGAATIIGIIVIIPSAVGAYNFTYNLDILCDENTGITCTNTTADPAAVTWKTSYCEVGAK